MDTIRLNSGRFGSAAAVSRLGPLFGGSIRAAAVAIADILLTWQERAHQRQALARLDDHMLRDIGLTRADVFIETSKPFWRA